MNMIENINILKKVNNNPGYTQRQLALELDYSLGKLNYCCKELKNKGFLKIKNSRYVINPNNKLLDDLLIQDEGSDVDLEIFKRKRTFLIAEIGIFFQELNVFLVNLPLINSNGISKSFILKIKFGHISDSTNIAISGFQ